jgi:hypothetical protein
MTNYFEEFDRHVDDHQFDLEQELDAALMALGIKKKEVEKLTQENARLRNALTYLTKDPGMFCCDCSDIREFCQDALEGKE